MATQQQIDDFLQSAQLVRDQSHQQIAQKTMDKTDKKILWAKEKMNNELTGDKDADTVVTTPQSQWTPFQIAVANLNPELKQRNKRYQSALNNLNILENEKVNVWQAGQLMMNAYKEAIQKAEDAANRQMLANSVAADIQAWWAISWMAWLATNPAAAAIARTSAQNQAAIQNAQVRSNTDQNIAGIYSNMAQVPSTMANMSATNAQIDSNAAQTEANANLSNAQAEYYRRPQSSWGNSSTAATTTEQQSSDDNQSNSEYIDENWVRFWHEYTLSSWSKIKLELWDDWVALYKDWQKTTDNEQMQRAYDLIVKFNKKKAK